MRKELAKKRTRKLKFEKKFILEIKKFKRIYCLISGGYHSTSTAYLLKDYGFKDVVLLHAKTYLEMKHALDTIQKVIYNTDYAYCEIEPNLKNKRVGQIFRESLEMIPQIVEYFKQDRQDYRDLIPCCKLLKKSSSRKFYTREIDKKHDVIISSLCPFESVNRNYWLKELREKDTYIRLHKKFGNVYYAYPWRDTWSDRPFQEYLISKGIMPEHSGCVMCPIQIAYTRWKND